MRRDHGNLTLILPATVYLLKTPPSSAGGLKGAAMIIFASYETSVWPRLIAPLLAGLLISAAYQSNAQAEPTKTFVISDQEGYGVLECLTETSSCGKIVADAWCEAHGHGPSRGFGPAEDVTASTRATAAQQPVAPGAAVIACTE
jgi:hypothetical protein